MSSRKLENSKFNYDMDDDWELAELENELEFIFNQYDVEYPSESEIMMTIDAIRPYVPVKESKWKTVYENLSSIMRQSLWEISYISPLFWISNSLLLLICLAAVFLTEQSPYLTMLLLAPIPTITGLFEVLKSMNADMAELEMSFKYNLQEIILSKMVVVGGFNLFVNLIFTCLISFFYHDILIWKLILYWITPFTAITAVSLVVVSRFRHLYAITVGLVTWIIFGGFISQINIIDKVESTSPAVYILVTLISLIAIVVETIRIYKRGVSYEFNH
jgi:hypothetical protein